MQVTHSPCDMEKTEVIFLEARNYFVSIFHSWITPFEKLLHLLLSQTRFYLLSGSLFSVAPTPKSVCGDLSSGCEVCMFVCLVCLLVPS